MSVFYSCLYSRDLTRKKKRWNDGIIAWNGSSHSVLFDEAGMELSRARWTNQDLGETTSFEPFVVSEFSLTDNPPPVYKHEEASRNHHQVQQASVPPPAAVVQVVQKPQLNVSNMVSNHKFHQPFSNPATYQAPQPAALHFMPPQIKSHVPPPAPLPPPPEPLRPRSRKEILRMIGIDCSDDSSDERPQNEPESNPPPPLPPLTQISPSVNDWLPRPRPVSVSREQVSLGADLSNLPPRPPPQTSKPFKVPSLTPHNPPITTQADSNLLALPAHNPHPHPDARTYHKISLPQPSLNLNAKTTPRRKVTIGTSFTSVPQYLETLIRALSEEVELKLIDSCSSFHTLLAHVVNRRQQQGSFSIPASGPLCHSIASEIQASCLSQRVPYFSTCELKVWRESKNHPPLRGKSQKRKFSEEEEEEEVDGVKESISLVVDGVRQRVRSSRMGDLWIVSSHPFLSINPPGPGSWSALVRSKWHGPNKDGKFEVEFLTPPPRLSRSQSVYCLKGPEAHNEIQMLSLMQASLSKGQGSPLLSHLISLPSLRSSIQGQVERCPNIQQLVLDLKLNEDQAKVITQVSSWVRFELNGGGSEPPQQPPLCLVHGPFGSGKSSLLIALVLMIDVILRMNSSRKGFRVLISAHTNVAVDRILTGLKSQGFTSFMRLGSLKKIDKRLLQQSVHSSCSSDSLSELKEMLRDATSDQDKSLIQGEIDAFSKGEERRRRKEMMTLPVVGATCCALLEPSCPLYSDPSSAAPFQLLILDECSQMMEPLSLIPILKSKSKYLVACGDPCQLPPVLENPSQLSIDLSHNGSHGGLARPMFVRMKDLGFPTILLRTQYRLHPELSVIPNKHFYGSNLMDGVSCSDRASVLGLGFPPLAFCPVGSGDCRVDSRTKSSYSPSEARLIAMIVSDLSLKVDLSKNSLGVICFFTAQVEAIQKEINEGSSRDQRPEVQVSTVDSFQGQEKDIIILATTIDRPSLFVADPCRLNVALTRARRHLIVVGVKEALCQTNPVYAEMLRQATLLTKDHMANVADDR